MPTALRGRHHELALVQRQLGRLRAGSGSVWLIDGGAGLGKSRLIDELARLAVATGYVVGRGVAEPADRTVQLAALMEALFGGSEPVLDPAALRDSLPGAEQRYWLLQDIQSLLERAALRRPIVMCLDDLQWSDSGTVAALRTLPGRLSNLPISWVLARRAGESDGNLDRAFAALLNDGADYTSLRPLGAADAARVSGDVLGAEAANEVLQVAADAHGNPFLLIELLSGLRDERLITVSDGRANLVEDRLPRRVRDTMRRRLDRMSPAASGVAAAGAAMGRRFTIDALTAMLATSPTGLLEAVNELIRTDILVEFERGSDATPTLGFRHDLVREAVRASQPATAMHALDRQAAATLIAGGALPEEVATRLASSAQPGDEVAITTLMSASDALGRSDPGQAADLARRALDLADDQHPLRGPLVARIAVLLHAAGRTEEAEQFADTALHITLPAEQEAEVWFAIARLFSLSAERRAEACRRALKLPGVPLDLQARVSAQLVYNLTVGVRVDQAERALAEASQAVEASQDRLARFTLELAQSYLEYTHGHFDMAMALTESAVRSGAETGEHTSQHLARNLRCGVLAATDRLDEAFSVVTDGVRSAQRHRHAWALNTYEIRRGCLLLQVGRLADAAAALGDRYNAEDAHLVVAGLEAAGLVALGRVALHTANRRQRDMTRSVGTVMLRSGVPKVMQHAAWLLALQASADGDAHQARRYLVACGEPERLSLLPLFPIDITDDPHLVRMALACGDDELAVAAAAAAQQRHHRNPGVRTIEAVALHANGLLTDDRDQLARCVALLGEGPRRIALASALEDLAAATRDADPPAAIAALDNALVCYTESGATWDTARVRRRLRRLGVQRRLPADRRPTHGWDAMTDSELAVVRLVAQGLTNRDVAERLYLSPHTVNGHLRQAFAKLGVNTRVALTRIALEHLK
ncbi:MAG TPA: AAA family ATPase [Pseudonocardia sp.]